MKKETCNWWTDPNNKEMVDRIRWWSREENKETFDFPISVIKNENTYTATFNDETRILLGDLAYGVAIGKTKDEAINNLFIVLRNRYEYSEKCRLNYQRFVPFRKGNWKNIGGKWFTEYKSFLDMEIIRRVVFIYHLQN